MCGSVRSFAESYRDTHSSLETEKLCDTDLTTRRREGGCAIACSPDCPTTTNYNQE
jgi:hypothetical protein